MQCERSTRQLHICSVSKLKRCNLIEFIKMNTAFKSLFLSYFLLIAWYYVFSFYFLVIVFSLLVLSNTPAKRHRENLLNLQNVCSEHTDTSSLCRVRSIFCLLYFTKWYLCKQFVLEVRFRFMWIRRRLFRCTISATGSEVTRKKILHINF